MLVMAGSIVTDVNSVEAPYEEKHSFVWIWIPLICCVKSLVFLISWGEFPTKGLRILASSFPISYVVNTLLETIHLRGISHLCVLVAHKILVSLPLLGTSSYTGCHQWVSISDINKIMLLGKTFSFTHDEANIDDLAKACP